MSAVYDPLRTESPLQSGRAQEALRYVEAWVRQQAPRLRGPVLDIGTSRAERAWIDATLERVTLDVCDHVGAWTAGFRRFTLCFRGCYRPSWP